MKRTIIYTSLVVFVVEITENPALVMALSFHQMAEEQKCMLGSNEILIPCLGF